MANLKFKVGGVWNQIITIKGDKGDAGDALPAGGVAGQLLIKNSATNNDATWQNNPSAPLSHTHMIANVTGLQSALDGKVDDSQVLTNVPAGAVFTDTVYTHPTTDGNLHVPATGTTNNGKVLKAGATAGSLVWGTDNDTIYTHPASHPASIITQDASNRFVTDAEKTTWNSKANGTHTHSYLPLSGGTVTGTITATSNELIQAWGSGARRGSLYSDAGAFGFLNYTGDWALRVIYGSADVQAMGNFTASGNVTAYSDERLKDNIETIPNALDKVLALRGVEFDKDGSHNIGVIAQEVQKVIPEVVVENTDDMKTLSVAYGNLVGLLIEAIKEQQKQIDELKAKVM